MAAFLFGPLGSMKAVVVSAGVTVESGRAVSEFVSAGGVRYVQRGRAAPRTWTVGRLWKEPEWARLFTMAAHGLLPECWFYDVAAARENMIPAQLAAGSGAGVLVGGLPLGAVPVGQVVRVPVLAGRLYSVSAWQTASGPLFTYRLDGGPVTAVASAYGRGSASFTPTADSILTITVTGAAISGLRANEGTFDGTFHAGYGTPCKVAVKDPERTLQMLTDHTRSDYTVTLMEVGKPGII